VRDATVALVTAGLAVVVGLMVGAGGWPGAISECVAAGDCSCEAIGSDLIAQPVTTVSSAAFLVVAIGVFAASPAARRNRMTDGPVYRRLFGAVAMALALGSAAFHGSLTEWGGWLDLTAVHLFVTFVLWYDLAVLGPRSTRWFLARYALTNVALGPAMWVVDNGYAKYTTGALIIVALVVELRLAGRIERRRAWLFAGIATYVVGSVLWLLWSQDGPWCRRDSLLQGHALWHALAAVTVWCVYRYLRSEATLSSPGTSPTRQRWGPRRR
jgi:hypothetical protein